jgi:sirohydrochlorin ferrochelatase
MSTSLRATAPALLLVDNGSLEPGAIFSLRAIAQRLTAALNRTVEPVSLLHSSTIPADQLGGTAAEILEPALELRLRSGVTDFLVVPLFFGPSAALTDYLPRRVAALREKFPQLRVRMAAPLVDLANPADQRIAAIMEERVRAVSAESSAPVILVDHGSPMRAVGAVRDQVAAQLQARLGSAARRVVAASMERRPGPEYAFADPLLSAAFDQPGFAAGSVVVAMLFVSPGRHAGEKGDVAQICAAARERHPGLRPIMTELVGSHPGLIPILVDRVAAGLNTPPL